MAGDNRSFRIVIVGAGFAGICLAAKLKTKGIDDFVILERAGDLGGVWRDNVYPGAACDVPALLYCYSFEQAYPWTSPYPTQREILSYLRWVFRKYGLQAHLQVDTRVVQAQYEAVRKRWAVATEDGSQYDCSIFVPAVGIFNEPSKPSIAGLDGFLGEVVHSAQWRPEIEMRGRKVGIVGTGASAVQIIPEAAAVARTVVSFQRTAPYVLPKASPSMHAQDAASERIRLFDEFERAARRRADIAASQEAQALYLNRLVQAVPDPVLRKKLTPNFLLGCKRTLFSDHWFTALQGENVFVETAKIERAESTALVCQGGRRHALDLIVFATGFNPSNYLPGLSVTGKDGARLSDVWAAGAEAYLGICVAGFPNMFLMYGPNTNVAGSIIFVLECQANFITQAVETLAASGSAAMDVRARSFRDYCEAIQNRLSESTLPATHCVSYFMNEAGRIVTNFPGTSAEYMQSTERIELADFHFDF